MDKDTKKMKDKMEDAMEEIKSSVSYVCKKNGGRGAVREFIDMKIV